MNNKAYKFINKTDYIYYLSEIIIDLITYKNRLYKYQKEIEELLKNNSDKKLIESYLYLSLSDRIKSLLLYLFNLIGDETKVAVSYKKFRKLLYRKRTYLNITIEKLPEEVLIILNNFNQHRNWGLHIPESLLVQKRKFLKLDTEFVEKYKNNIIVPHFDYYEIKYLKMLNSEVKDVLSELNIIEQRMIKDYGILIDEKFSIEIEQQQVKPYILMQIVENSLNMQRGKNT